LRFFDSENKSDGKDGTPTLKRKLTQLISTNAPDHENFLISTKSDHENLLISTNASEHKDSSTDSANDSKINRNSRILINSTDYVQIDNLKINFKSVKDYPKMVCNVNASSGLKFVDGIIKRNCCTKYYIGGGILEIYSIDHKGEILGCNMIQTGGICMQPLDGLKFLSVKKIDKNVQIIAENPSGHRMLIEF
jgi:hypothetical protein